MDNKLLVQDNALTTARYEMTALEKNIMYAVMAQIEGYTSTTGTEAHNKDLSEKRAKAVRNEIVALMGSSRKIPDNNISSFGYGEEPAIKAGEADGVENQAWRKVEVLINGNIVLTLR